MESFENRNPDRRSSNLTFESMHRCKFKSSNYRISKRDVTLPIKFLSLAFPRLKSATRIVGLRVDRNFKCELPRCKSFAREIRIADLAKLKACASDANLNLRTLNFETEPLKFDDEMLEAGTLAK